MPDAGQRAMRRPVPRIKVVVPAVPPGFVSRPRLVSVLDQADDLLATLVCAPAGSGKTLLLADWIRRRDPANTAWVSLDSDDNDDRRFWSAVLAALAACPSVPPDSPFRAQPVPSHPSQDLGFLAAVVNALDDLPGTVRLVFDDVHELTDPRPLRGLETLLRHQPAGLRLVLASRHHPSLPLARLRLADRLAEIRGDELRFYPAEAEALLESAGVDLPPDQLRRLVEQTEGWAAGLRLAAVSLSEADDPGQVLAEFAVNDRTVADYLIDEVLSRLPGDLRELLRTVSVCDEVPADLAADLSGFADVGTMLDMLERKTSPLVKAGAMRRWYRIHPLVRSSLLADLTRQEPARAAALHAKAAGWFAHRGQPVRALAHAGRTEDAGGVARLLRRQAVPLTLSGEHDVLRRALAVLGEAAIADDSLFALVSALLHLEGGEPKIAALHVAHADAGWPRRPGAELETLRRLVRSRQAQVVGDVDDMMRATDDLGTGPDNVPALDALAMLHRGTALLAADHRAPAREQLRAALDSARARGQSYVANQCLSMLAAHAAAVGEFRLMTELARAADREAVERGWRQTIAGTTPGALLAYGALLRAEPAECLRQLNRAGPLADAGVRPGNRRLDLLVGVLGGAARFETGDWSAGLREMREARLAAGDTRLPAGQAALSAVLEHRAASRFGWGDVAQEVLGWAQVRIPGSGEIALMRARAQAMLGRHFSAVRILRPLFGEATHVVLPWSLVEAWLVEAEAARVVGEEARAVRALKKALARAESLGVRYPLVFGAPEVVELLTAQRGKLGALDRFAADVLTVRRDLATRPVPAPLTRRERSILRLLPTLRSFDEIAEDLTVSPNTVKTHVRSIYAKLGVRRRRDAVMVAMERGLLQAP